MDASLTFVPHALMHGLIDNNLNFLVKIGKSVLIVKEYLRKYRSLSLKVYYNLLLSNVYILKMDVNNKININNILII